MKNNESKFFTLKDGSHLEVTHLTEAHRKYIKRGFTQLSSESRQYRFLNFKKELSEEELDHLTKIDGKVHFALVAAIKKGPGVYEGVGVIRAHQTSPGRAELAIAVIDKYQGLGIGNILMKEIIHLARDLGYQSFTGEIDQSNGKMKSLIEKYHGQVHFKSQGLLEMNLAI